MLASAAQQAKLLSATHQTCTRKHPREVHSARCAVASEPRAAGATKRARLGDSDLLVSGALFRARLLCISSPAICGPDFQFRDDSLNYHSLRKEFPKAMQRGSATSRSYELTVLATMPRVLSHTFQSMLQSAVWAQ